MTLTVLVTGIGGGGHGEQILKALRLGARPYRVIGTDVTAYCAGRSAVDAFEIVPPARDPAYLDAIIALSRRHRARVLFHGSEPEMAVMSANRDRLESEGLYLPVNPSRVLDLCQDKAACGRFLERNGFPVPRSAEIGSNADLAAVDFLPAVLKPSVGGGGSANVFVAQTACELEAFGTYLLSLYPRFVVQEYVGRPEDEFTVGVLCGEDGVLINSIAVKRVIGNALSVRLRVPNRANRPDLGPSLVISSGVSQGIVGRFREVTEACERIALALGASAPVNIQGRLVAGRFVPFEINPRFSGTTSIRAMAGYNEPDTLIRRDVLGERIEPHFAYREIVVMRSLQEREILLPG